MPDSELRDAKIKVEVDGTEVEQGLLKGARVDQVADGPAYAEVKIQNQSAPDGGEFVEWPAELTAEIGSELKISFGYEAADTVIFDGKITGIGGSFHESDAPNFKLLAFDPLHQMTRGRLTKQFQEVMYSDVVSTLVSDAGLSAAADTTDITMPWISMTNQTPLGFIQHLARRVGYEVRYDIEAGNVFWGKPKTDAAAVATLTYGENLKRAVFRAQTAGQMTKVIVRANDDLDDKPIDGESTESDVADLLGGFTTGPAEADTAFGEAEYWITGYAATTQAEVDEVAIAIMNEIAYEFVQGEVECEGDVAIFAGKVVTLEGVAVHFSGDYYVIRAIHLYDVGGGPNKGYRTRLDLRRPAWTPE